jgi:NADH dehydrogenase
MLKGELNVVTGAFGYTGGYITRELLAAGARVRTLTNHARVDDPLAHQLEIAPFNFDRADDLARNLDGVATVFNTYWIRFPYRGIDFAQAVGNLRVLIDAARRAGVRRFVHVSIANANSASPLPYFAGKGMVEEYLANSGLSYAIVRPAVIFGAEEILLNNIAWMLRRIPLFAIPGDGNYRLQPVFVDDLAKLALDAARRTDNLAIDAVGPEIFTFNELIALIAREVGSHTPTIHLPPSIALACARIVGRVMGDVALTRDEVRGLMANLLVSPAPPTAPTRFSKWLRRNAEFFGVHYASEVARR